jgi:hypothetical protein
MKTDNKTLLNFVRVTLKGNLDNSFEMKGKPLINVISRMLKEERSSMIDKFKILLNEELDKANYNSFMSKWQGLELENGVYEKLKEKILIEVQDRLKEINR